jgi:chromosome segregation ATPase
MKPKNILFGLAIIVFAVSYYLTTNNDTNANNTILVKNKELKHNNMQTKISNTITKEKSKTLSNKQIIKKVEYSKVALPKDIREIEHNLVDIQNQIVKDKLILDQEAKEVLVNANLDKEIQEADKMLEKLNKESNIPQEKIDEIENSYTVVMNAPITSAKSVAVQNDLINIDKKVLDIEKDFEKLQKGDI